MHDYIGIKTCISLVSSWLGLAVSLGCHGNVDLLLLPYLYICSSVTHSWCPKRFWDFSSMIRSGLNISLEQDASRLSGWHVKMIRQLHVEECTLRPANKLIIKSQEGFNMCPEQVPPFLHKAMHQYKLFMTHIRSSVWKYHNSPTPSILGIDFKPDTDTPEYRKRVHSNTKYMPVRLVYSLGTYFSLMVSCLFCFPSSEDLTGLYFKDEPKIL